MIVDANRVRHEFNMKKIIVRKIIVIFMRKFYEELLKSLG